MSSKREQKVTGAARRIVDANLADWMMRVVMDGEVRVNTRTGEVVGGEPQYGPSPLPSVYRRLRDMRAVALSLNDVRKRSGRPQGGSA